MSVRESNENAANCSRNNHHIEAAVNTIYLVADIKQRQSYRYEYMYKFLAIKSTCSHIFKLLNPFERPELKHQCLPSMNVFTYK